MTKRALVIVAAAVGLFTSSAANAQEWLKDRRYTEGAGIKTGDFELHPGIAGEIGYDSNWLYRSDKSGANIVNGNPEGAAVLRITPSLYLSTIGPQRLEGNIEPPKIQFRAGLAATYREFFGSEIIRKQRNLSAQADARVDFLPQRPWGGALFANYTRTIQPNVVGNPDFAFNRNDIGVGGELVAQPGGGTLDWRLGYQFRGSFFEEAASKQFNNQTHELYTRGRWKFRPRTALLYDGTARFISYSNANALTDSTPLRARLGINGLVTSRFSLLAMAGYGASFFKTTNPNVQQFDSVIGHLEAKFFLSANPGTDAPSDVSLTVSSFAVGYLRDFQNSLLGNFYGLDRGYAKLSYFFAGRALLSLEGGVGAIQYPNILGRTGAVIKSSFTDLRADATLFGEYRIADSVGINSTLRFTGNFSQNQIPVEAGAGVPAGQVFDMNWKRFEAFLGARWFL